MPDGRDIIAVIMGASEWPEYPNLDPSPAFLRSAEWFRDYLFSEAGLDMPEDNLFWVFDDPRQPGQIGKDVREFITGKIKQSDSIEDIIFYYVGHGGYLDENTYFLALRCTSKAEKAATIYRTSYLTTILSEVAFDRRHIIILDACYSGGALAEFAKQSDEDATKKLRAEVERDLPTAGTALFCAAGPKKWAKTPLDAKYTMFTGALSKVLEAGSQKLPERLSVRQVGDLVTEEIKRTFRGEAVRPNVFTPVQENGDVAEVPFFPNPAARKRAIAIRLADLEQKFSRDFGILRDQISAMSANIDELRDSHTGNSSGEVSRGESEDIGFSARFGMTSEAWVETPNFIKDQLYIWRETKRNGFYLLILAMLLSLFGFIPFVIEIFLGPGSEFTFRVVPVYYVPPITSVILMIGAISGNILRRLILVDAPIGNEKGPKPWESYPDVIAARNQIPVYLYTLPISKDYFFGAFLVLICSAIISVFQIYSIYVASP